MTVNDLTKMLLSNKFKEFIALIRISRIKTSDDEISDGKTSNNKFNDSKTDNNDKNDEKFMTNYYKADEEADKEISFETEKAE